MPEVRIGATLGIVFGRRASRVSEAEALAHVAGYRVVADLSAPHDSYFRPALKQQCRDGFCPIGRALAPAATVQDPVSYTHLETEAQGRSGQERSDTGVSRHYMNS